MKGPFRQLRILVGWGILLAWLVLTLNAPMPVAVAARAISTPSRVPSIQAQANSAPGVGSNVFLPFISGGVPPLVPLLVGTYPVDQYLGDQAIVNQYLLGLDSWAGLNRTAGKGHTLAGTFMGLEVVNPAWNIPHVLDNTWNSGYVAFINIMPDGHSAANIANGCCEAAIEAWADNYLAWTAQGGNRRAYLAPMPEMNWHLSSWSYDPAGFIAAYRHIQSVFEQRGVTRAKVWWVFAPNGYSSGPYQIRDYYPGDAYVDIVGFSSYNQSYAAPWMSPITSARCSPLSTRLSYARRSNSP